MTLHAHEIFGTGDVLARPRIWVMDVLPFRYDTIRDAILTCAQKLTEVSLIYRRDIEPMTFNLLIWLID